VTEVFDHTNGVIKKNVYKKSNVAIPSDTPWRAPCLVNGSSFLVRTLPLSEYYRVIGFKKLEDDRKKARANWFVHGVTMDTWFKTLPSQRTTRSNTLNGLYKAMISSMESILGFHSANLKFRAAKLRLFRKRNNCLSSVDWFGTE